MRHLVLALLLALLPLRGWVADTMGVSMPTQRLAQGAADTRDAMPADCPMHQAAEAQADDTATPSNSAPCQSCDACELCLPLSLTGVATAPGLPHWPQAVPGGGRATFASAERAGRFKPPIS